MTTRVSWPLYLLALFEAAALFAVFFAGQWGAYAFAGVPFDPNIGATRAAVLDLLVILMVFAVGLYSWRVAESYAELFARILVALVLAFVLHAVIAYGFASMRISMSALVPGLAKVRPRERTRFSDRTISPLSPVSTQPSSPSNRTGQVPVDVL